MGAGDVKALAALGSVLGADQILQVFLYMALAGGLMAILHYVCSRNLLEKCRELLSTLLTYFYTRDLKVVKPDVQGEILRFPYAAAIAFGFFAHVSWGDLI
jgi:prepilin peptidase CpaA